MLFRLWALVLLASVLATSSGRAHPIPTLVVEAVFHADHSCELRVNLDPRLFLNPVPSSLPPIPGSWWHEQDEAARLKTKEDVRSYLSRTLRFLAGDSPLTPEWEVLAIDSTLTTPLSPTSAEAHLLARHHAPLPPTGDFRMLLDKGAAVPAILINSREGDTKLEPQSVFPGESSKAYVAPARVAPASPPSEVTVGPTAKPIPWLRLSLAGGLLLALVALAGFSKSRNPGRKAT